MSLRIVNENHDAGRIVLFGVATVVLLIFAMTYVVDWRGVQSECAPEMLGRRPSLIKLA